MTEPFIGEIRMMSFAYAPDNWALCNGQLLPINQNQALFSLLGTTFGGNGQTNFALPDLRGRVPIHAGSGHTLGERFGETAHTLTVAEMPQHVHFLQASTTEAEVNLATGNHLAVTNNVYAAPQNLVAMGPTALGAIGGSQPHNNMQPYLTISFCIALIGIFPSQN